MYCISFCSIYTKSVGLLIRLFIPASMHISLFSSVAAPIMAMILEKAVIHDRHEIHEQN